MGWESWRSSLLVLYFFEVVETHKFLSDAGSINVILPEDASFEVDAKTDVGSIRCNFPMNGQSKKSHTKLHGKAGNPPYATLTLKTDVGSFDHSEAYIVLFCRSAHRMCMMKLL